MLSVIFETFWIWYFIGVALWAFLGLLAASRQGLHPLIGVALGGAFWFVGVAALVLLEVARLSSRSLSRRATGRPTDIYGAVAAPAFPTTPGPWPPQPQATSHPVAAHGVGSPINVASIQSGWNPLVPGAGGVDEWGWPGSPGATTPRAPVGPPALPQRDLAPVIVALVGGIAAIGMLISLVTPWGSGRVAWSRSARYLEGTVSPASVGVVGALVVASALVVLGCAFGVYRAPRGLWLGLAAVVATFWFALIAEWLVVVSDASSVTGAVDHVAGSDGSASLSTSFGAWLMFASCCAVYALCAAGAVRLLRDRALSRPAGSDSI